MYGICVINGAQGTFINKASVILLCHLHVYLRNNCVRISTSDNTIENTFFKSIITEIHMKNKSLL